MIFSTILKVLFKWNHNTNVYIDEHTSVVVHTCFRKHCDGMEQLGFQSKLALRWIAGNDAFANETRGTTQFIIQ